MKRFWRSVLLCCMVSFLLAGTAFADVGPKPQLVVKVVNGPEEPYYLDLLAEGVYGDSGYDGLEWRHHQDVPLDEELLDTLREAVPEGWHACTAQGSMSAPMYGDLTGENGIHTFSYRGVPGVYRVLVVTQSGETWVSDILQRKALQTSVTIDWALKSAKVPPIWLACALQILSTLIPTILIEGLILLAFRFDWKKNWKPFLLVNMLTQGVLSVFAGVLVVREGFSVMWILLFVPVELVIALVEAFLYMRFLQGQSRSRAFIYGLTANAASAIAGWFLIEHVWRWIVSIS